MFCVVYPSSSTVLSSKERSFSFAQNFLIVGFSEVISCRFVSVLNKSESVTHFQVTGGGGETAEGMEKHVEDPTEFKVLP